MYFKFPKGFLDTLDTKTLEKLSKAASVFSFEEELLKTHWTIYPNSNYNCEMGLHGVESYYKFYNKFNLETTTGCIIYEDKYGYIIKKNGSSISTDYSSNLLTEIKNLKQQVDELNNLKTSIETIKKSLG